MAYVSLASFVSFLCVCKSSGEMFRQILNIRQRRNTFSCILKVLHGKAMGAPLLCNTWNLVEKGGGISFQGCAFCRLHDKAAECSQDGSLSERSTCICSGLATIDGRTVWANSLGEQLVLSAAGMHGRPSLGFGEPAPNECVVSGRSCPAQRWHPWPCDGTWLLPSGENPWQLPGARKGMRDTGQSGGKWPSCGGLEAPRWGELGGSVTWGDGGGLKRGARVNGGSWGCILTIVLTLSLSARLLIYWFSSGRTLLFVVQNRALFL